MKKYIALLFILAGCSTTRYKVETIEHENVYDVTSNNLHQINAIAVDNSCPSDMVHVVGEYCTDLEEICLKYGDPDNKGANGPVQCLEFKYPTRCLGKTVHMDFCIDKYPYPNKPEELPTTNLTWYEAKALCEKEGKRLAGRREFTQACRGPENKPYPYGYVRDCSKCNCDRTPWLDPKTHTFEELDKRVVMGSLPECRSDYGVMNLVGNNDRWVYNETERPYKSALVGGHTIGGRNRCSPATLVHFELFSMHVTGALCARDINK